VTPTLPSLGQELNRPCPVVKPPVEDSYEAFLESHLLLLEQYGRCAKAHNELLKVWSKYERR